MEPGAYVLDVEDDNPDLAVALHVSETPIGEWELNPDEGEVRTVAEDNPDYDESEPVVVVAFVESGLNTHFPEWSETDPDELYDEAKESETKLYHFPESRLTELDEEHVAAFTSETTVAIGELRERLEEAEWETELSKGALVVEKIGEQYQILPDGTVNGDGQVRTPLENIVSEYTS